jgi:cytoskeletal protein CcmA (bactofilin family)
VKRFNQKNNFAKKPVADPASPEEVIEVKDSVSVMTEDKSVKLEHVVEEPMSVEKDVLVTFKPTIIEVGAVINGDVSLEGDLIVSGQINGNVSSKSSLTLSGKIYGDISCDCAQLDDGIIVGNLQVHDRVYFGKGMSIKGNVMAKTAIVEGKIMGNCTLTNGLLHLQNTGAVVGDVVTTRLIIDDNAIVQGAITVNRDVYFEIE